MNYALIGHDRNTAVKDMLICLLPEESHTLCESESETEQDGASTRLEQEDGRIRAVARVNRAGRTERAECALPLPEEPEDLIRVQTRAMKTALFHALRPFLPEEPAWGAITGVKPAKAVRLGLQHGMDEAQALRMLEEEYFVSPGRRELCVKAARMAIDCEEDLYPGEVQLYVGIPFCPTKCSYCGFISSDTRRTGKLIEPYLEALHREIEAVGAALGAAGHPVGSLYIGGGTPSILDEKQLDGLLGVIARSFDLSKMREYSFEAGRPDTINREKLHILKQYGIERISINPQSMHERVLANVGRMHGVAAVRDAYALARETGGFIINMDLIAGLPGDSPAGLLDSVNQLIALGPENITIHSLAKKRGAGGWTAESELRPQDLDACYAALERAGYQPYYLYKQKYSAGGLENVGFCRADAHSHYNICMMEELSPVIAMGAGGVSKTVAQGGRSVSRQANPKYATEYIGGIEEICRKKRALFAS